jgi:5'-3' exoribonuclease 2
VDITGPNPNGEEFDNLYLDMNGIVHPCSHPEDRPPPANEEEMMYEIFKYTERVVNMVRPRKLLMMAVGMFAYASGRELCFPEDDCSITLLHLCV